MDHGKALPNSILTYGFVMIVSMYNTHSLRTSLIQSFLSLFISINYGVVSLRLYQRFNNFDVPCIYFSKEIFIVSQAQAGKGDRTSLGIRFLELEEDNKFRHLLVISHYFGSYFLLVPLLENICIYCCSFPAPEPA